MTRDAEQWARENPGAAMRADAEASRQLRELKPAVAVQYATDIVLREVQRALECYRDKTPYTHPTHGTITLEELKYLVIDPVVDAASRF